MQPRDRTCSSKTANTSPQRPRKPPQSKAATWDQQKALDLAVKGAGPTDIAPIVGVSRNTVLLYLKRVAPELDALRTFKDRLDDSLALSLVKCLDLEDKLLDTLNIETVLSILTPDGNGATLGRHPHCQGRDL